MLKITFIRYAKKNQMGKPTTSKRDQVNLCCVPINMIAKGTVVVVIVL
jgi:hypothetical protein